MIYLWCLAVFSLIDVHNIFNSAFMLSWACYPILGALLVPISIFCYEHLYKYRPKYNHEMPKDQQPFISIFIPAHNEQADLKTTATYLATKLNYTRYEIIIIDDGSTDKTPQIADHLANVYPRIRTIHATQNAGKAHGYNVALGFANGSLIYSNDADTIPEPDCLWKFAWYFIGRNHRDVGAVTGNMDVMNRNRSLDKAQVTEFSSIIGGIKRAQNAYAGHQYGFSGATLMIRKDALIDAGGFSQSIATEDIDLTVRLIRNGWEALFAPNIESYMQVPHTMKNLYKERKRWAQGGTATWLITFRLMLEHPYLMRQRIPIQIDATVSNTWSFLYWILLFIFIYRTILYWTTCQWTNLYYLWMYTLVIICFEFVLGAVQMFTALHYDEKGMKKHYFIFCWQYLVFTWLINPATVVTTCMPATMTAIKVMRNKPTSGNSWGATR